MKAKIYIPTKTAMQSGRGKLKKWLLEFISKEKGTSQLMGWESSNDTLDEVKLFFTSKDKAVEYAQNNNIDFEIIEPNKKKFVIKSYEENFTKN
jgi:hypothetical protein